MVRSRAIQDARGNLITCKRDERCPLTNPAFTPIPVVWRTKCFYFFDFSNVHLFCSFVFSWRNSNSLFLFSKTTKFDFILIIRTLSFPHNAGFEKAFAVCFYCNSHTRPRALGLVKKEIHAKTIAIQSPCVGTMLPSYESRNLHPSWHCLSDFGLPQDRDEGNRESSFQYLIKFVGISATAAKWLFRSECE